MGTDKRFIELLEVITNMNDFIIEILEGITNKMSNNPLRCEYCEGELPEDKDCYGWDDFKFCSEDCLYEYLEDGE